MVNRKSGCWIEPLNQASKTTNIDDLGVRNCIAEAIACEPPGWARDLLVHALEKDVSTAKEDILSVCVRYYGDEDPCNEHGEGEGRNKETAGVSGNFLDRIDIGQTMVPCPESVTECCRNALREVTMKDAFGEIFNLVHGKARGLLDLHLINMRMKSGTYCKLPELFLSDMQEMWDNVRAAGEKIAELASTLSDYSKAAYQKQVAPLFEEEAEDRDLVNAPKRIKWQSTSEECEHERACSINQHHMSKPNNQLGCGVRPEEVDTSTLSNMKATEENGRLIRGMEAENVSHNEEFAPKSVDTNQCILNKHNDLPSSEELELSTGKRVCRSCGLDEHNNLIILCDACEEAYHTYCISPPIEEIPNEGWFCASCVASGKENMSMSKDDVCEEHHCVVCERLSKELEPQISSGVSESHLGGEKKGTYCDRNEDGLQRNKGELEINQDELADRRETVVYAGTQEEKLHNNELPVRKVCKICSTGERETDNFIECANTNCPSKYFHLSCLKPPLECIPAHTWYCPSCICVVCHVDENDDAIVLCDGCDDGYHIYCLKPPLATIPKQKWFCSSCRKKRRKNKERCRAGNDSKECLQASNASLVGNTSSEMGTRDSSEDHEMMVSIPQVKPQNVTPLANPYSVASLEAAVDSNENFGSKDNFRISFRTKNASIKGSGKRKRKPSESKRSEG